MVIYLPQIQLCQIQCLLLPSHINSHPIIKLNSAHNGLIHEAHLPAWYVHSSPTPFPSTPDGVGGQKYPPKQTYRSSSLRPTSPLTSPTATPPLPSTPDRVGSLRRQPKRTRRSSSDICDNDPSTSSSSSSSSSSS